MGHLESTAPKYRDKMSEYHLRAIVRRTCLHIDVFLVDNENDELYYMIETRIAGHHLLKQSWLRITEHGCQSVITPSLRGIGPRYLNNAWARRRPWLERAHNEIIRPLLVVPHGYKSISVRLHYIDVRWLAHDPCKWLANYYDALGRGRHSAKPRKPRCAKPRLDVELGVPATKLDRASRSKLRTLDKLLGLK